MIAYHYTSLSALYSIVKDRRLLLTSICTMNDPAEGSYSVEKFLEDIDTLISEKGTEYPFLTVLRNETENQKDQFVQSCKMPTEPYSTCFTKKRESLSHWERYSQQMTGVCIAFNLDELMKINPEIMKAFQVNDITYDDQSRRDRLLKSIEKYVYQIADAKKFSEEELEKNLKNNAYAHLAAAYQSIQFFIKNQYWTEEDEIRLLYDDKAWHNSIKLFEKTEKEWKIELTAAAKKWYSSSGLSKREYINSSSIRSCRYLNFGEVWNSKLIPEILLGPFSRQNISDFKYFLKDNGLTKTKVEKSKIKVN